MMVFMVLVLVLVMVKITSDFGIDYKEREVIRSASFV